jgi:hypothetical protein
MKIERIFACACAVVGGIFLLEQLRTVVTGWPVVATFLIAPLVIGGVFAHLGSWRNRDAFASSLVALALLVVQALIVPSSRSHSVGKALLGGGILAGIAGLVMMIGAWIARRVFLDAPVGAPTLLVISTLVTTCFVYYGAAIVHRDITSSSIALVVFETGFALLAGIATQRIAPIRHVVACGAGATVLVAWTLAAKLLRGNSIELDFSTFSDVFLVAAGFAGAAIGVKLRREPRPSYAEFD